jgi:ArsR family transcriptional regulator, arsenate/arsenite/antimonite-responsive transcriptional repressor
MKQSPDLVTLFQAFGDQTRLRLLNLMRVGELCVCYFIAVLDEAQPKISRHLAYLRRAGIVKARRDGKWIHYSLNRPSDPTVAEVFDATLQVLGAQRQMKRDQLALQAACCAVNPPDILLGAPRPAVAPGDPS